MHEIDLEDIFLWADRIKSALGTSDLASRITDEEVAISAAILGIMKNIDKIPDMSKERGDRREIYDIFDKI